MSYRAPQVNFSKGEIAPDLMGRFDVSTWQAALKTARNVVVLKFGGVTFRPGTRLVAELYDSALPGRLLPFQFATDQAYAIDMGQGTARFCALGGLVIEEELAIISISQATQAVVEVAYHGVLAGDEIYFTGVAGMVEINGRVGRVVTVIDANRFSVDINSTAFGAFTSATGGITRTVAPTPPDPAPVIPPPVPPEPPPYILPPWVNGGAEVP